MEQLSVPQIRGRASRLGVQPEILHRLCRVTRRGFLATCLTFFKLPEQKGNRSSLSHEGNRSPFFTYLCLEDGKQSFQVRNDTSSLGTAGSSVSLRVWSTLSCPIFVLCRPGLLSDRSTSVKALLEARPAAMCCPNLIFIASPFCIREGINQSRRHV